MVPENNVLKQVEESLESILFDCDGKADCDDGDDGIANRPNLAMKCEINADAALTALRGLEWTPIAEMAELEKEPVYVCIAGYPAWVSRFTIVSKKRAVKAGYTHFCRPILPTPPKREVE